MDENGMKFNETQIDDLTKAMFDDADPDHRGGDAHNFFADQKMYFYISSNHIRGSHQPTYQAWRSSRKSQHQHR